MNRGVEMLNNKILKSVNNLVEMLVEKGWHVCNEDNTVIRKGKCIIFFDRINEPENSFQYNKKEYHNISESNVLIVSSVDEIAKSSWHAEYEGVVIFFGKIPTLFTYKYEELTEKNKCVANDFVASFEEMAANAENLATMSPAKFTSTTINVITPSYTEISSLSEGTEMTVLDRGKEKPFVLLKKMEDKYAAIPIALEQTATNHKWVVHPDFTAQHIQPPFFTEEEIYEIIKNTEARLLNVGQYCTKDTEFKWKLGDNIKMPNKSVKDILDINVDDLQLHYLDIAYDNKLNLATLVKCNYDAITLKWLIKFMLKDYNIEGINTSLSESSLSVLYDIASAGFFINKYTNPDLNVDMIKNLHNQFLAGFSKREENLQEQGYSAESIDAILKIASRGDGIAHVMYKEPAIKLYLRDYALQTEQKVLIDYIIENGVIENNIITVLYEGMPSHLKEEIQQYVDCIGDIEISGVSWKEFCGFDSIKKIIFREDLKLLIVTDKGYIKRGKDYVSFKSGLISTDVCITCINGKVIVED